MPKLEHVTLSQLEGFIESSGLPRDLRVTVSFEEGQAPEMRQQRVKAQAALAKLRGSGNGGLVRALLRERERDAER